MSTAFEQSGPYEDSNEVKQMRATRKKEYIDSLIESSANSLTCDFFTHDQLKEAFAYFYKQSLKRPYLK